MKTIIYVIRHGDVTNPLILSKVRLPEFPLSAVEIEQAYIAAKMIEGNIDMVYSSPLLRTMQTAEIKAPDKNTEAKVSENLNE